MKYLKLLLLFAMLQISFNISGQQTYSLKGKVIDSKDNPLPNVNILIKNTTTGTSTNTDGIFELNTTIKKITLVVSNVGFEKQEIKMVFRNDITTINISLNSKTYQLEAVTVNSNHSLENSSTQSSLERQKVIAGGTNVISMKSLNTKRSLTLKDALHMQPGVMIQEFFGANDQPRLNIRGSGIQSNPQRRGINLLQDGISTNFADGSYIIGILEPRAANHIEVFRGANGLKYGSSTLGGAINLVSKNGYTATSHLEIHLEGGSFGYYGGNIASGFVKGKTDGFASVSYNQAKGYRDFNTSERLNAMFNIGHKLNDKFETRLYATYTNLKFDISGPLTQDQLDKDPTKVSVFVGPNPKTIKAGIVNMGPNVLVDKPGRVSDVFRVANKNVYKFNDTKQLELGIYYQYADDTFVFPISTGIRGSISNDLGAYLSFTNKTNKNNLALGVNASTGEIERKYYNNVRGEKGKLYADNNLTASNFVLFAENLYKFTSELSGTASIQVSLNSRNNKDVFEPLKRPFFILPKKSYGTFPTKDSSLDQDYVGFNPKLGLIYDISKDNQVFFNVSKSYEPPTFDELLNQGGGKPIQGPTKFKAVKLDAQTGTTLEIGSRGTFKSITWDASFYHTWVNDEILTTTDLFGTSGFTRNSVNQTIHQGLEFGLKAELLKNIFGDDDKLNFNSVYNFSNFYFDEGIYKNNQIGGIPKHYIASSLEYKNPKGFFVNINTEWLPEDTATDHQNTVFQKAYQLFGFRTGYSKSKWGLFVEGKNITNQKYASSYLIRDVVMNPKPPMVTNKNLTTFVPGVAINFSVGIYYKL